MGYRDELYINVFWSTFVGAKWVYIRKGYESIYIGETRDEGWHWDDAKRPQIEANNPSDTKEHALAMAEHLLKKDYACYPGMLMSRVRELLA